MALWAGALPDRRQVKCGSMQGVDRVSQAVAGKGEGEHRQHDGDHGKQQPWIERDRLDVLGFRQEHAPTRDGGAKPESEKGQGGFGEHVV